MSITPLENLSENVHRPTRSFALRTGWLVALIIASAFILRLGLVISTTPDLADDTSTYLNIAKYLTEGKGYTQNGTDPTRVRTPGYPVFLATVRVFLGENPRAILFVQAILGTLTIYFVYQLALHLFGLHVALLASAISAYYPALVYYDSRILRESLTAFLVMAVLFAAHKAIENNRPGKWLFGTGALIAAVSMCRPELLLLFGPVAYLVIEKPFKIKKAFKTALVLGLPILIVWGSWTIRNVAIFGNPSPVAIGITSTLWFGSRWAEIGGDDHKPEERVELQQKNLALSKDANETNWEKNYQREVWKDMVNRPGWMLKMVGNKAVLFWKNANGVKKTLPAIHPALPILLNTYYYGLLICALIAILLGIRKNPRVRALAIFVLSYMTLYALLHVRNRYRVPVLPVVFILSASGFWAIFDLLRDKFISISRTQK